jgi:hypothetical protein
MNRLLSEFTHNVTVQGSTWQKILSAPWSVVPFIVTLVCLAVWAETVNRPYLGYVAFAAGIGFLIGVLYFFYQFLGRIVCGQWLGAFFAVVRIILCVAAIVPAVGRILFGGAMWEEQQDHFADNLTIPSNIQISSPITSPSLDLSRTGEDDSFQRQMLAALQKPASNSAMLTPSSPSLRELVQNHRALLMRYLESSPAWRVYEGRGGLFAARRWQFGTKWISTLNDEHGVRGNGTFFGITTVLLLNAQIDLPPERFTWMDEGPTPSPVSVTTQEHNRLSYSSCLIRCGGDALLKISEQSTGQERRMTEAALNQLETEFKAVLDRNEFDPSQLPPRSTKRGTPSLNLYGEHGIYDSEAWVNPGEPGIVYLKAYEITHNTPLSAGLLLEGNRTCTMLYQDSNERIGWSPDGQELFLSATHITMTPGGWGKPYAARFELWFKPDSGKPERKLLTRNFIVEGYEN